MNHQAILQRHDPLCPAANALCSCNLCNPYCTCDSLRAAYQRGREDAAEAMQRVRDLHDWITTDGENRYCMTCVEGIYSWGAEREVWPCSTLEALDAAARGEGEQA